MGDLRPDNGGPGPDDGGARGLPDLPPEWGTIVIPDDASELSDEVDALRRELRGSARRAKIRKVLGLRPGQPSSLGIPFVIMTVAILTTLVSLLVVTWGNQPNGASPLSTSGPVPPAAAPPSADTTTPLTQLTFSTGNGDKAKVGDLVPLIFVFTDGCDCQQLVKGLAAAVPKGVRIAPVTKEAVKAAADDPTNVVRLTDPVGTLHTRYLSAGSPGATGSPDGSASAVVVNGSGAVVAIIQHIHQVADVHPLNP